MAQSVLKGMAGEGDIYECAYVQSEITEVGLVAAVTLLHTELNSLAACMQHQAVGCSCSAHCCCTTAVCRGAASRLSPSQASALAKQVQTKAQRRGGDFWG